MCKENTKQTQLGNLLDKPVYFLELFKEATREDGTKYLSRTRKFLRGRTFLQALDEARRYEIAGFYDKVKLYRMRSVVDSVSLWPTSSD